jgi:hypothetical protein
MARAATILISLRQRIAVKIMTPRKSLSKTKAFPKVKMPAATKSPPKRAVRKWGR